MDAFKNFLFSKGKNHIHQQMAQKGKIVKIVVIDKPEVKNLSKDIIDKVKGDILQCCSLGSNRDKFCDFTVVVGDTEFPCHRFVLSACSEFFEALLRSDMKESREMRATVQGISPEIFKLVLDVIYGSCEVLIPDKMIEIWKAAHQLQIHFLLSACESHFMNNVNADNCYLIYTHAQFFQSTQVRSFVLNYIVQNFYLLIGSENLMKFDYEDFLQIIQDKNLPICNDLKIVAILKWCQAGNKSSKIKSSESTQDCSKLQFLGSLIQAVDLTKVMALSLADLLTNPFIQEDKIANSAVNSQAAKKLSKSWFKEDDKFYTTRDKNCPHCQIAYSSDSSDSSDSDD